MSDTHSAAGRKHGWLTAVLLAALFAAAGGGFLWLAFEGEDGTPEPQLAVPYARSPRLDDSGFGAVQAYMPRITDPLSLEHIRDCYHRAGYRGIEIVQRELAAGVADPRLRLEKLITLYRLTMYEGEFAAAAAALEQARALVEGDPRLHDQLPTILFYQGLAALRRGETENCVECPCTSSCIFPIDARAIHQQPDGSRQAIRYFTEYLRHQPDDLGVRWLMNVAAMTLGEYPAGVPPAFLIPPETFRSEFTIGPFTDIAAQVGITRLHPAGGAIMDDFDGDGLLDLVETTWDPTQPMAFSRNRGDGTFADSTAGSGLDRQLGGLYCVQTDYNNDGWLDIYVCRGAWTGIPQRHSLLRNNGGGTFTDVTREAGLLTPVDGQVAAWADYDNDGWLDLFVGGERTRSRLYHNNRDGTFTEVALRAGVANEGAMCKGANWGDFDGDGFPDLFLNNLGGSPGLYRNNRDGTFTNVAIPLGITGPSMGFSCWFWDYDNDGWLDLFAASYDPTLDEVVRSLLGRPVRGDTCRLYRNVQGRRFEDVTAAAGLDLAASPMGSNFADFDNDGFLDFYLGTGDPKYSLLVPNRMFKNVGGRRFADVTWSSRTGHLQKGHGVACGDWDRDGDVDLYEQLGGAVPGDRFRSVLFQNPGQGHRWLTVRLIGQQTNRPAVGARITVVLPGEPATMICRHVTSGSSFGANPFQQTIGLGTADRIERLEVHWPTSNTTQVFRDVPVNQAIEITEFAGISRRDAARR